MPTMGSVSSSIKDMQVETVPAYYHVSDFAMRRDWYGLSLACKAQEITHEDIERIERLLQAVTLSDLVILDAQLQAAGVGQAMTLSDSVLIDETRLESVLQVAASLEAQVRQQYLANCAQRIPSLIESYRQSIIGRLKRSVSYRFSGHQSIMAREVHRLVEVLHGGVLPSERPDILKRILRRDPRLLAHLLNGEYVTITEARRALNAAHVHTLDKIRLALSIPELYSEKRLRELATNLDLAALAQLRYESPQAISDTIMQRTIRHILAGIDEHLGDMPSARIDTLSRFTGLFGNDLEFTTFYKHSLSTSLENLGVEVVDQLRQYIALASSTPTPEMLQSTPVSNSYNFADALIVTVMLGEKYDWCKEYADVALLTYADTYLSRAQQIGLFDERLGVLESTTTELVYGELYRLSMKQKVTMDEISIYASNMRTIVEMIRHDVANKSKQDVRVSLVLLAYIIPVLHDAALRARLFTLMDESVFLRLLNEALAGSTLAQGFLSSLTKDEALRLIVRWGNTARNGYILKMIGDVDLVRYERIAKELQSRDIEAMPRNVINDVVKVLTAKPYKVGMTPEKSIMFVSALTASYGIEMARRIVGELGIDRTEELEDVSPFYMRLLVDALNDDNTELTQHLLSLSSVQKEMTYEQAQGILQRHYQQRQSFARDVVASLRRAISGEGEIVSRQARTELT